MRLFVAVPLPENIKQNIKNLEEKYVSEAVRFIPGQNLHLTIHFMGDATPEQAVDFCLKLKNVAASFAPFNLAFQEVSPGPKLNSPRLIWVRFREHETFNLLSTALCQKLEASAGAFGKFIPHITIARFRIDKAPPKNLPVMQNIEFPDLPVTSFALWQSVLGSPHPVYTILENFELTGNNP